MDWDGIGTFALFLSMGGIGAGLIFLNAFRMKLKHKLDLQKLRQTSSEPVDQLRDEMHDLIDQQAAQVAELQERLDFAERLLAKGHDPAHKEQ